MMMGILRYLQVQGPAVSLLVQHCSNFDQMLIEWLLAEHHLQRKLQFYEEYCINHYSCKFIKNKSSEKVGISSRKTADKWRWYLFKMDELHLSNTLELNCLPLTSQLFLLFKCLKQFSVLKEGIGQVWQAFRCLYTVLSANICWLSFLISGNARGKIIKYLFFCGKHFPFPADKGCQWVPFPLPKIPAHSFVL